MRLSRQAISVATVVVAIGGCSSDESAITTTTTQPPSTEPPAGGPTPREIRVRAQEQLGRAVNGVDYECDLPVDTEPGTEFSCLGELNGQELHVIATINPDGTVTLTMLD
jgi:hypothetical protein